MSKVRSFLILAIAMVSLVLLCCSDAAAHGIDASFNATELTERELRSYANEHNTWVLCYKQGSRSGNYSNCDATNQNLYFTYSVHDCVDVYDLEGNFLYSILFPHRQNGVIYVRCNDTQAYIRDKDGIVYIFEETDPVKTMEVDAADSEGYDFYWFYHHEPRIEVDGQWITILEGSEAIHKLKTPEVVSRTMSIPMSTDNLEVALITGAVILLFLAISYYVAHKKGILKQ